MNNISIKMKLRLKMLIVYQPYTTYQSTYQQHKYIKQFSNLSIIYQQYIKYQTIFRLFKLNNWGKLMLFANFITHPKIKLHLVMFYCSFLIENKTCVYLTNIYWYLLLHFKLKILHERKFLKLNMKIFMLYFGPILTLLTCTKIRFLKLKEPKTNQIQSTYIKTMYFNLILFFFQFEYLICILQ